MPTLTIDTSAHGNDDDFQTSHSCSTSPSRPPFSPITPTLSHSRLDMKKKPSPDLHQNFTHSQDPQVATTPPTPQPIDFNENPDVLALKATISILQMQQATALKDIQTLQRMKERALKHPQLFTRALVSGEIKMRPDPLFYPKNLNGEYHVDPENPSASTAHQSSEWEMLPTPQNIVRTPPINFAQYAVVSESLDKLHADQVARPAQGEPQRTGPVQTPGETAETENRRPFHVGVAAPYQPLRDKMARIGAKRGKRR